MAGKLATVIDKEILDPGTMGTVGELKHYLFDDLDALTLSALWKLAEEKGVRYQGLSKHDIVESILNLDEIEFRKALAGAEKPVVEPKRPEVVIDIPADERYEAGKLTMTIEDLAIAYAALLLPETILNLHVGSVERWSKSAFKKNEDTVVFTRTDENGHNRRYEVKLFGDMALTAVDLG